MYYVVLKRRKARSRIMAMTPEQLRDGIFSMNTRRFGTVAEVMIKKLMSLGKGKSIFHDLYDGEGEKRVEVKFSTARRKSERRLDEGSALACIEDELSENRQVSFANWKEAEFDCNIQQVKKAEFDVLYYGVFFHDQILIFRIDSGKIGSAIGYSDKQHKGNEGEGQFHISQKSLQRHLDGYLQRKMSYAELLELLGEKSEAREKPEEGRKKAKGAGA